MTANSGEGISDHRAASSANAGDETVEYVGPWGSVASAAVFLLPGVAGADVRMISGGGLDTVASSGDLGLRAAELQVPTVNGPSFDAAAGGVVVRVDDLTVETRWSSWRRQVVEQLDLRSVLSVPITDQRTPPGSLTVYSRRLAAFDGRAAEIAATLTSTPALAVAMMEKAGQLANALETRSTIGQAMGLLMAAYVIDDETAFKVLARWSSSTNVRVAEVARRLVSRHVAGVPIGQLTLTSKSAPDSDLL